MFSVTYFAELFYFLLNLCFTGAATVSGVVFTEGRFGLVPTTVYEPVEGGGRK